jgi:cytochrome c biogenesis protein
MILPSTSIVTNTTLMQNLNPQIEKTDDTVQASAPSTLGLRLNTSRQALNQAVELLSSMRFSIALLMLVAAASVIGTVVEQNKPWVNYVNQFGIFWAEILQDLGVFSIYNSWWFLLIMAFLVLSLMLCLLRNVPLMLREMRSFKDRMGRAGVLAHPYRGHSIQPANLLETQAAVVTHLKQAGYQISRPVEQTKVSTGYMIAAKKGTTNRWGYILAHSAMVIILVGGLLDSELPLNVVAWFKGSIPVQDNQLISQVQAISRLPLSNPSYRANVLVPEGATTQNAVVNYKDGVLVQPLPFELTLKKFNVEYYSTGMPKLFTSDVIVRDPDTGERFEKRIIVNEPLTYKDVTVYQSSFDDGGSRLQLKGYPLVGKAHESFPLNGIVGERIPLPLSSTQSMTVEFSAYRPINVEDFSNTALNKPMNVTDNLQTVLGVPAPRAKHLRNVGPSVMYKLRDSAGQAKEYHAYQLPIKLGDDGQIQDTAQSVFLLGMRRTTNEAFKFVRFPADADGSATEYMRLRAAFTNPTAQQRAATSFALKNMPSADQSIQARQQLQLSAEKALVLFAGSGGVGGFTAIANFIDKNVPKTQAETMARVILRVLSGAAWEVWQQARAEAGLPVLQDTEENQLFLQTALTAYSDSFLLEAPFMLMLEDAQHKQASVFQVTKSPGKWIVYLGALLLVMGVFAMFYIRERRLWVWLTVVDTQHTDLVWALSAPKRGLAFDREYSHWKTVLGDKK